MEEIRVVECSNGAFLPFFFFFLFPLFHFTRLPLDTSAFIFRADISISSGFADFSQPTLVPRRLFVYLIQQLAPRRLFFLRIIFCPFSKSRGKRWRRENSIGWGFKEENKYHAQRGGKDREFLLPFSFCFFRIHFFLHFSYRPTCACLDFSSFRILQSVLRELSFSFLLLLLLLSGNEVGKKGEKNSRILEFFVSLVFFGKREGKRYFQRGNEMGYNFYFISSCPGGRGKCVSEKMVGGGI